MAILNPHFGTEHQKGHIMLTGHADTGGSHILLQHTHALDILDNALEKGHGIILDNITIFIDEQHAQIMNIKMLLALLIKAIHILYDELVGPLVLSNLLTAQLIDFGHGFVGQIQCTAAQPAFGYPRMHVGIHDALFHKLLVVRS